MIEFFIVLVVIVLVWMYSVIQKRIGESQSQEWEEYKKSRPDLFVKPSVFSNANTLVSEFKNEEDIKKFVEGVWARHNAKHSQHVSSSHDS